MASIFTSDQDDNHLYNQGQFEKEKRDSVQKSSEDAYWRHFTSGRTAQNIVLSVSILISIIGLILTTLSIRDQLNSDVVAILASAFAIGLLLLGSLYSSRTK